MEIHSTVTQDFKITITMSLGQARALDAIVGYGFKAFIEVFKEKMGRAYIEGYEEYAKQLFEELRQQLPAHIDKCEKAKTLFNK